MHRTSRSRAGSSPSIVGSRDRPSNVVAPNVGEQDGRTRPRARTPSQPRGVAEYRGEGRRQGKLPPAGKKRYGVAFRVPSLERVSYALVMESDGPVTIGDNSPQAPDPAPASRSRPIVTAPPTTCHWLRLACIPARRHAGPARPCSPPSACPATSSPPDAARLPRWWAVRRRTPCSPCRHTKTSSARSYEAGNRVLTPGRRRLPAPTLRHHRSRCCVSLSGRTRAAIAPGHRAGRRTLCDRGRRSNAEAFARTLCPARPVVVSGLALGIDAAAHRGARRCRQHRAGTVAVIGTGIDRIYPARNAALAREIAAAGAVVSEFPRHAAAAAQLPAPQPPLIAGLAEGVLVVEAALGSGSLITARPCHRDRPRGVRDPRLDPLATLSRGCHRLIRDGAKLVETAEDVVEELRAALGWPAPVAASVKDRRSRGAAPRRPGRTLAGRARSDGERNTRARGDRPIRWTRPIAARCGF